jgi:hypothetical protein
MSLLENQLPNRLDIGNTQAVFEPYHAFCIFSKILQRLVLRIEELTLDTKV